MLALCIASLTFAGRVIDVTANDAASISEVVAKAQPGDTIRIASGTYKLARPLTLEAKGTQAQPIRVESQWTDRAVLDFSDEPEDRRIDGIEIKGDYWQVVGIEVAHAGSHGINISGNHNLLERCVTRENRNTGTQISPPGSHNLILNCESFRNCDFKTKGEDADGFAAKHEVGPGNVFRGCRSYQNADDGWDFWMAPNSIPIEDCVAFRNGYNIWKIEGFQGDGNGFKFGGNYVATPHVARRCVSIENPLHGFDQNHNVGGITLEDCIAIRCGVGFSFPEVPRSGQDVLRRNTSFGCSNVLERHMISEDNQWWPEIPAGGSGPPPRPGHRDSPNAGAVPTTQEAPLVTPSRDSGNTKSE